MKGYTLQREFVLPLHWPAGSPWLLVGECAEGTQEPDLLGQEIP